jgi:hypothetical protein
MTKIEFLAVSADLITLARQMHSTVSVQAFVQGFGGESYAEQDEMLKMLAVLRLVDGNSMANLSITSWTIRKWF